VPNICDFLTGLPPNGWVASYHEPVTPAKAALIAAARVSVVSAEEVVYFKERRKR
jgi:hypothetical protein